ncbi:MAG: hypothetical protein JKY96_02135 [Phycisphaerales bacterium]|nr:hypothetical protein [Phycisphaerales bacterium]
MRITGVGAIVLMCMMTGLVQAEPFTYQGQLKDGGVLASGMYDFSFFLHDTEVAGSVIAPGVFIDDLEVVDGVFSTELDFGDAFNGDDRWLRIGVRPGAQLALYTTLNPRTAINSTPKALHANVADVALNVPWMVAPGIITYTGEVFADRYVYNIPKTQVISVSGRTFVSGSDNPFRVTNGGVYQASAGPGTLFAPLHIPNGALITSITVYCSDTALGTMNVSVSYESNINPGFLIPMSQASTLGSNGANLVISGNSPTNATIHYASRNYFVSVASSNWPGGSSLQLGSVVVEYTIDEVD